VGTTVSIVLVLVVAVFSSITAPLIISSRAEKRHREDRQADWDRQDQVAEKAAQAATDLAASQKAIADQAAEAARLLVDSNERAAANAVQTLRKLDGIATNVGQVHTLVNQKLTDATERALAATVALLSLREEMAERVRASGGTPTTEAMALIERTRKDIADLENNLASRTAQQAIVDESAAAAAAADEEGAR